MQYLNFPRNLRANCSFLLINEQRSVNICLTSTICQGSRQNNETNDTEKYH